MWIMRIMQRIMQLAVSDHGVWITAWIACFLVTILLLLVTEQIRRAGVTQSEVNTTEQLIHYVRRHTKRGGVYQADQDVTTVLNLPTNHWAIVNDDWRERDHPVSAHSTGRHSVHNPARVIVPSDWRPPIGSSRIRMLETETVEVTDFKRLLTEGAV